MITLENTPDSNWPKRVTCKRCQSNISIGAITDITGSYPTQSDPDFLLCIECPNCIAQINLDSNDFTQSEKLKICSNSLK